MFESCKDCELCPNKDCPSGVNFNCVKCQTPVMVSSDRSVCHFSLLNDMIFRCCFDAECIEDLVNPDMWEHTAPPEPKEENDEE